MSFAVSWTVLFHTLAMKIQIKSVCKRSSNNRQLEWADKIIKNSRELEDGRKLQFWFAQSGKKTLYGIV
jgi:hypothetical protein